MVWLLLCAHGQGDSKRGAAVDFAGEVYGAVVELHHAKRHGEADSGAAGLGGVEEGKDSFLGIGGNAHAGIADFEFDGVRRSAGGDFQLAALGHRLASVQNQVQQRWFDEVAIDAYGRHSAAVPRAKLVAQPLLAVSQPLVVHLKQHRQECLCYYACEPRGLRNGGGSAPRHRGGSSPIDNKKPRTWISAPRLLLEPFA